MQKRIWRTIMDYSPARASSYDLLLSILLTTNSPLSPIETVFLQESARIR